MFLKKNTDKNVAYSLAIILKLIFLFQFDYYLHAKVQKSNHDKISSSNKNFVKEAKLANINWDTISIPENEKDIIWERFIQKKDSPNKKFLKNKTFKEKNIDSYFIASLNRSIVFGDNIIGPDISWLVPPGFKWTNKYKFDSSIRGYNQTLSHRRKSNEGWGWNQGDAVGQFYYQFFTNKKYSLGTNFGMRSVTAGHSSPIGDGLSAGFRWDYKISEDSGLAIGAEQLLHFDNATDTGRDIYVTLSKAFWKDNLEGQFPLKIATGGIATGRLAEGNIKGLCSDLLGGSGTEVNAQRSLCWAPVFSLSYLFNEKFSTFFEYNSRFFLLGSSVSPFKKIPLRGTFALTISDHIQNYKINNFDEITWTFRISLGY